MGLALQIGLSLTAGAKPAPFTPLSLGANLLGFWDSLAAHNSTDAGGVTPVAAAGTDTIGRKTDLSGNGKHRTQATAGFRPVWNTGPARGVYDGVDDHLAGSGVVLTGDVTCYALGTTTAGNSFAPFVCEGAAAALLIATSSIAYVITDDATTIALGIGVSAARRLFRWRRRAGNWWVAWTGQADQSIGSAPNPLTFTCVGNRFSSHFTTGAHEVELACQGDQTDTGGADALIQAWFGSTYGVTL